MGTNFRPFTLMNHRLELARADSDTAYFYDLLYYGEMLLKLTVAGVIAGLQDDKDRHRYRLEHKLIRANGVGEWFEALEDALIGPASQILVEQFKDEQRSLTQLFGARDNSWQNEAVHSIAHVGREIDPGLDALPTRVSLRRWYAEFCALRNRTRGHGAPTAGTCAAVATELEASISKVADNHPLFKRSWAYLHRNLSGKFRVSSFGGDLSAFDSLKRSSSYSFADGVYLFLDEPRAVRLVDTDVDLSDFYVANGGFNGTEFEELSYITDDKHRVSASGFAIPPSALPPSETQGSPELLIQGNWFGNVPPRRPDFVHRGPLETELLRVLRDDRHPVVSLTGRGGVGKTSLALEVLDTLSAEGRFSTAIWCSARDIDLLPYGAKLVTPHVLTRDDIARFFVELVQPTEVAVKGFDRVAYLGQCLSNQGQNPLLFVVDNFETVRNPIDLYNWLDNTVRLPNKILITSRSRDFKGDYPIDVGGMSESEFEVLVESTSKALGISHLINDGFIQSLYLETDGHPYIAKVILGEVASKGHLVAVPRFMADKDALLDALFERSFQTMTPGAQRVFLTLCNWRSMVPRLALEAALLRPANERLDVDFAIESLRRTSLVDVVTSPTDGEEFLRVPLAAAEFGRRQLRVSATKSAVDADTELLRLFGTTKATDLVHGLEARVDRFFSQVAGLQRKGQSIDEYLPVFEYVARRYPQAWLRLADLYEEEGTGRENLSAARDAIRRYLESKPTDSSAWRRLVRIYRTLEDVLGEVHARVELAEIPQAPFTDISNAANRLNEAFKTEVLALDREERKILAERLRKVMVKRVSEADATDYSRLAWLCINLGDHSTARAYVERGLTKEPDNPFCLRLADKINTF